MRKMDESLLKRIQSLSPEKRHTLEVYLKSKGIKDPGALLIVPDDSKTYRDGESGNAGLEIDKQGANKKKELPIKLTRNITTFLARAFILTIILADEKMYPWYYQHFVQVCSQTDNKGYTLVDFMEPGFPRDVIEPIPVGYDFFQESENINEYVKEKIDEGYYLAICLDEYYLNEKAAFNKEHFVHESLVYGYDDITGKFLAAGFDAYRIFDKITFDYAMFAKAFAEGKLHYKKYAPYAEAQVVLLLKPKSRTENIAVFNLEIFLADLNNYLHSVGDISKVFLYVTETGDDATKFGCEIKYGVEVYDVVIRNLENLMQNELTIDYRALHLLSEHKKIMYERLQYIVSHFNAKDEAAEVCRKYLDVVVNQIEDARRQSLVQKYSEQGLHEWDHDVVKRIIDIIKAVREEETAILTQVFTIFSESFLDLA